MTPVEIKSKVHFGDTDLQDIIEGEIEPRLMQADTDVEGGYGIINKEDYIDSEDY